MGESTNRLFEEIKQLRESMRTLTNQFANQDKTVQNLRREVEKLKRRGSSSLSSSDSEANDDDNVGRQYSMDISIKIPNGIHPSQTLCIKGSVPRDAIQFSIGLRNQESGDIILHINPRYHVGMIPDQAAPRTDFRVGHGWGPEETCGGNPFTAGLAFKMDLECTQECFLIRVNNNLWCSFAHRQPYTLIDQVQLKGQMNINSYSLR